MSDIPESRIARARELAQGGAHRLNTTLHRLVLRSFAVTECTQAVVPEHHARFAPSRDGGVEPDRANAKAQTRPARRNRPKAMPA
ncbi:hypothetical protein [Cognatishimia sp. F0-27]|uniref:hypothetical protein n=1 Tax=Cognatishimia sp. F0-27 TaxID=2816855 RepID=UPI001D0C7F8F|nr:hypothetical protein [Cognatishimia sp. F0-27]MCC1494634.1 hypothetical protein [Cognatishimia sp. F0-27]